MATTTSSGTKTFSIANFRDAFQKSRARQYMSDMEVEQVRTAVEEKNIMLLGQLYDVLLQEQVTDEQIVRDFVMTKNKLLDNFTVASIDIEKKLIQKPQKKRVARAEKKERKAAEKILTNL